MAFKYQINGHMVMKQFPPGQFRQLMSNRHLSDCRRPKEHDEIHLDPWGISATAAEMTLRTEES